MITGIVVGVALTVAVLSLLVATAAFQRVAALEARLAGAGPVQDLGHRAGALGASAGAPVHSSGIT